jgi:hypothetical protein
MKKLLLSSWLNPGSGKQLIPDSGFGGKKTPDPGSPIRNTDSNNLEHCTSYVGVKSEVQRC